MAGPQSNPEQPQNGNEAQDAFIVPMTGADEAAAVAKEALLNTPIASTDDAPTIISNSKQAPIRFGDLLGSILRGRQLAHFELLEPVGVGGMAAVIRARDTQLDRTVALKILPPDTSTDPEIVKRFH